MRGGLLAPSALALLLAAISLACRVEQRAAPGQLGRADVSPSEIMARVGRTAQSVESYRSEVSYSAVDALGPTESTTRTAQAGPDFYQGSSQQAGVTDERLYYRGEFFYRSSPEGHWQPDPETQQRLEPADIQQMTYAGLISYYSEMYADLERLEDTTIDGQAMIHLGRTGRSTDAGYPTPFGMMGEPYTSTSMLQFWIGVDDFLVYQMEESVVSTQGKQKDAYETVWTFTDHNGDVELPGPMPEP